MKIFTSYAIRSLLKIKNIVTSSLRDLRLKIKSLQDNVEDLEYTLESENSERKN